MSGHVRSLNFSGDLSLSLSLLPLRLAVNDQVISDEIHNFTRGLQNGVSCSILPFILLYLHGV